MSNFETLLPADLEQALSRLLATPGQGVLAEHRQVQNFMDYLTDGSVRWEGLRCGQPEAPLALFLAALLPGSTAIILIPTPDELGIDHDDQHRLTIVGLEHLRAHKLHFAQALLQPEAGGQRRLLQKVGFSLLAPLVYMERDVRYPWVEPPAIDPQAWTAFSRRTYDEFAATLLATYEDSQDCPELSNLRPIDDIISGHQASGHFDPGLWELLRLEDRSAGCLLLSPLRRTSVAEVVYMGVVPEFRGRGIGTLLLQRGLQRCRERGVRRLTLAVDDRNKPARHLYTRLKLRPVARRDAYLYRLALTLGAEP